MAESTIHDFADDPELVTVADLEVIGEEAAFASIEQAFPALAVAFRSLVSEATRVSLSLTTGDARARQAVAAMLWIAGEVGETEKMVARHAHRALSWAEIGAVAGVSKQSAFKRYAGMTSADDGS